MEHEPVVTAPAEEQTLLTDPPASSVPDTQAADAPQDTGKRAKRRFSWGMLGFSLALLLVGVVILIKPDTSSMVLTYVVSALMALAGLVRVALYFIRKEGGALFSLGGMAAGLSLLAIGVFLLLKPDVLMTILHVALGCVLIFAGFASLQSALVLLRVKQTRWYIPLTFAVLSLACGFLALADPFVATKGLMLFLGVALCAEGLFLLILLALFGKVDVS